MTDPLRWKALALLGAAFFMVVLDSTIVLTAIPVLIDELGFTLSGAQWVMTAYALAFAGLLLFFGRVADVIGRRRAFLTGSALFTIASLACGLAPTAGVLVATRALQGVAAAVMAPAALSIVVTTFSGQDRNRALGVWGALGGVGATTGLLLGGVITSALGWEWVFLINVPVGVLVAVLGPRLLRESRVTDRPRSLDLPSALAVTAAMVTTVYAIIGAPAAGWASARTLGLFGVAVALFGLTVVLERRSPSPLVPIRVLRAPGLLGGTGVILAAGMAVDAMLFAFTLRSQQELGHTALRFGLTAAVMTVLSVGGAAAGQAAVGRFGARLVALVSMALIATGALLMSVATLPGLAVFGVGLGGAFVAAQIVALGAVADEDSGVASGVVDTSFSLGSALGIAIAASAVVSGGSAEVFPLVAGLAVIGAVAAIAVPGRDRSTVG